MYGKIGAGGSYCFTRNRNLTGPVIMDGSLRIVSKPAYAIQWLGGELNGSKKMGKKQQLMVENAELSIEFGAFWGIRFSHTNLNPLSSS